MTSVYELLRDKRDGRELSPGDIREFVAGVVAGKIADYQASAFLMAAAIRGLSTAETAALTTAMRDSGETWDLSDLAPVVDKHSTGGVGDKITLVLAPLAAACGARVGMMSGRGLGHTGGTLDKLAAIPGFRTDMDLATFRRALSTVGAALNGQTGDIAPADRILYALRDVTGTVESEALIVASILSKKLASGTHGIVFDVKCGDGAFMKTRESARSLGRALVATTRQAGRQARGWITDMGRPLGVAVGNANEVAEAIAVLRGDGPAEVRDVSLALGAEMLDLAGIARDSAEARALLSRAIADGSAARKLEQMIEFQGGDPRVVEDPGRLPRPERAIPIPAGRAGVVQQISTEKLGHLAIDLGCGRRAVDDVVDLSAGILVERSAGDRVAAGETLAVVQVGARGLPRASLPSEIAALFEIGDGPVAPPPRVLEPLS